MLNWIDVRLARAYLLFAFLAQVGLLQIVAARRRWVGLSFADYKRWPGLGYGLGVVLLGGAYGWFFTTHPEIWQPGPAGSELTVLFAVAGLLAIAVTLTVPELARSFRLWGHKGLPEISRTRLSASEVSEWAAEARRVTFGASRGVFYPAGTTGEPGPVICVMPGPYTGNRALRGVVAELTQAGFAVLVIDLGGGFLAFPEVLAVLPSALSFLERQPTVDAARIGALGFDVGGDVIIRSASTDRRVRAIAAVGPLLDQACATPGLNALRELTHAQALRWSGFRGRGKLVMQLAAIEFIRRAQTPPFLLFAEEDSLIPSRVRQQAKAAGAEVEIIPGAVHFGMVHDQAVMRRIADWFGGRLGIGA